MTRSINSLICNLLVLGMVVALPMSAMAANQAPVEIASNSQPYYVGVEVNGQSRVMAGQVTPEMRAQILKNGYASLRGEAAIKAFITQALQSGVDQGNLDPNTSSVLMIGQSTASRPGGGDVGTEAICCATCYDVYDCYPNSDGSYTCYYRYTYCEGCYYC
jgi:hypothetical protein